MSNYLLRLITRVAICSTLAPIFVVISGPARAQSAGDIVILGSPDQQARFRTYWNELLRLNTPKTQSTEGSFVPQVAAPQLLEKELMRKLRVSGLQLKPVVGLGGSSEVIGSLTNSNAKPVTVSAVNYEITDAAGKVLQTGSAIPEPATIKPGKTVTFKDQLLTTSARGKSIKLAKPAFVLQAGV